MSRELIDRQELLDAISDRYNQKKRKVPDNLAEGFLQMEKLIKEQPIVNNTNWIPVSERLPEESLNSVIGWGEYRECCCFVQYYGGRWILGDDTESVKIVAWMPLPEPYKERK